MATTKELFQLVVQADVAGGATAIRGFAQGAKRDIGEVQAANQQMAASLARGGAQVAAAGAAGLAALTAMGLGARKSATEVIALQRVAGGSVEEVSKLRFAAQQTGVGLDTLSTGFVRLSRNAASDKGAASLARYGIEARTAAGEVRPLGDLLTDIAGVVANMPNGAAKNDLVVSLFGRGGAQLLPLLNRGAEGLAELGVKAEQFGAILDGRAIEASKRYTRAQRDMAASTDALTTAIGSEVLPELALWNERAASVAVTTAKLFARLPEGVKQTAVGVGLVGSEVASVGGAVVSFAGSAYLASQGVGAMKDRLAASGSSFGSFATGAAAAAVATAAFTYTLTENQRQQDEVIDAVTSSAREIQAAFDPTQPRLFNAEVAQTAALLLRQKEIGPASAFDKIKDFAGLYGKGEENANRADAAKKQIEAIGQALDGLSTSQGRQYLDGLRAQMIALGGTAKQADSLLGPLYKQLGDTDAAQRATAGLADYGAAVERAASKTVTLTQALEGLRDGIDPGELTVFADALSAELDPVNALVDAHERVAKAQRALADASKSDATEITSAYKRVADAKARLDEVLRGDGNNLEQVSPEVQIADARRRIFEADAALVANPLDAAALAKRDEALADENRAVQRRQELKRDADQRAKDVASAQSDLADAQKALKETQTKRGENLQDAQDELVRAGFNEVEARAKFVDGVKNGTVKLDEVGTILDQLVSEGILPQSVRDEFMGKVGDLATQAGLAAAALQLLAGTKATAGGGLFGIVPGSVVQPPTQTRRQRQDAATAALPTGDRSRYSAPLNDPEQTRSTASAWTQNLPVVPYTPDETKLGVPGWVLRMLAQGNATELASVMIERKGRFPGFAAGGLVDFGSWGVDQVPIRVTRGEGVVSTTGMRLLGAGGLAAINAGQVSTATAPPVRHVTYQGDTITVHGARDPRATGQQVVAAKRRARLLRGRAA